MPITQPLAHLRSSVFVAFLFLWECRLLLCCWFAQLLRWLVICVSRVACDFVSRLGGWDTYFFLKDRLVEPVLGGPRFFVAEVLKPRHVYPILLSWRMVPASVRHMSFFGVRPRSGHLQAVGCTRWLLDGCFTTKVLLSHFVTAFHVCNLSANRDEPRARYLTNSDS